MNAIDNLLNNIAGKKGSHFWIFLFVLIILTVAMMALYQPLCPGQDFFFHFRRFQALMDALKASPFLIYLDYSAINGYGYFAKAFYSDVILIPFAAIGNVTDAEFGYLSMIFTMTVLCGIFTYKAIDRIYDNSFAAFIGALLFAFSIYRILDVYHRAALGEALSFTFIPLVFWGLYEIINGNYKKWYILAIGYSLLIFTHVISSVLTFVTMLILLAIYYKPLIKEPKRIYSLLFAGLATLLIVSYYLFPMLEQMSSNIFYYNGRNMMAKAGDMTLDFHWIMWGMFSGIIHPKQLFIPGTGLLLTCVVAIRIFITGKSPRLKSADIGVIIGLIFIFMCTPLIPWSVFPFSLLNFIQMPWRLFEFSSYFFAVAGGYYLSLLVASNKRRVVVGLMVFISILMVLVNDSKIYKEVRCYNSIEGNIPLPPNGYHMGGLEYLPAKVPSADFIEQRGDSIARLYSETKISPILREKGLNTLDIETARQEVLELPLTYYSGYKAELNGKEISVAQSDNGLIQIEPKESGKIKIFYNGTTLQVVSWFISLFSIAGLCIYIFMLNRKNKQDI